MKSSLTVVLPLHNAQSIIADKVDDLLEHLPELCSQFEIVLVDDGSTDMTVEAAHELSLAFPQVQLIIHSAKLGPQESLRSALRYSQGELLLACARPMHLDAVEIKKLWERRTSEGAVYGNLIDSPVGDLPKPPTGGRRPARNEMPMPDMLLVPRRLLSGWSGADEEMSVIDFLRRRGYALRGVAIRAGRRHHSIAAAAQRLRASMLPTPSSTYSVGGMKSKPMSKPMGAEDVRRRPTFLSKLKAFTWGE